MFLTFLTAGNSFSCKAEYHSYDKIFLKPNKKKNKKKNLTLWLSSGGSHFLRDLFCSFLKRQGQGAGNWDLLGETLVSGAEEFLAVDSCKSFFKVSKVPFRDLKTEKH